VGLFQALVASAARTEIETRRGRVHGFRQDDALRFLQSELPARDAVFVYPYYPMYYFLADLVNPTRHSILMYGINTDAQFASVIGDLERHRVKWILWDARVHGAGLRLWFPNYRPPAEDEAPLERYIRREYDVVGMADDFRILRRRDGGGEGGPRGSTPADTALEPHVARLSRAR
jgi:hypothetical protein